MLANSGRDGFLLTSKAVAALAEQPAASALELSRVPRPPRCVCIIALAVLLCLTVTHAGKSAAQQF